MIRKEIETCEDLIALDNALRAWRKVLRARHGFAWHLGFSFLTALHHNQITYGRSIP